MKINEIFYSIQGEGKNTGKPTIFVRLSGCNLHCDFCDTKYALNSGHDLTETEIINQIKKQNCKWVCITGGEPFLQDLKSLTDNLKKEGYKIQIETNGTIFQPVECDWLVVSPKKGHEPDDHMLLKADEIKLVINSPETLNDAKEFEEWGTDHFVQPVNNRRDITKLCVDFIKANPKWNLSMQLHKLVGVK